MSSPPAPAEDADGLIGAITEWVQQLIRMNALVAAELQLVPTDLHCLHVLHQQGPMTTGKIGEHVGLSAGAATRMVDRLASAGFVTRTRSEDDRRVVAIAATPTGLERAGSAYGGLTERTHTDLASFTPEECRVIIRFVEASTHSVSAELRGVAARST